MSKAASLFSSKPIQVQENPEPPAPTKETTLPSTKQQKLKAKKKKEIANKLLSNPTKDFNESRPYVKEDMSVAQVKERESRTVFVGNVGLQTTKKAILKMFKKFGAVENMWVRSLPLDLRSKVDMKGTCFIYIKTSC